MGWSWFRVHIKVVLIYLYLLNTYENNQLCSPSLINDWERMCCHILTVCGYGVRLTHMNWFRMNGIGIVGTNALFTLSFILFDIFGLVAEKEEYTLKLFRLWDTWNISPISYCYTDHFIIFSFFFFIICHAAILLAYNRRYTVKTQLTCVFVRPAHRSRNPRHAGLGSEQRYRGTKDCNMKLQVV